MVTAVVNVEKDEMPNNFGWLQFEKKGLHELQKLALKSPAAMGTLMYMVNNMSRSNALVVSQSVIAKTLGIARPTASNAVRYLQAHNFIQIIKAGNATIYVVNTKVAWQGNRGERFAHFAADVIAVEADQEPDLIDDARPLKSVPVLHTGERILVGNEAIDPPDQGELLLP